MEMITQEKREQKSGRITKRELLDLLEKIPGRIDMLPEMDKALIQLFLSSQKFRLIAIHAGVHEVTIMRRIKKIAQRINSNDFVNALSNPNLPADKLQILKDYFIANIPMYKIARKNNVSYYEVRTLVQSAGNG